MIIRFLDGKEICYQVDTFKTPALLFIEGEDEINQVNKMKVGDCLISIPKSFDEETSKRFIQKLNSKEEPKNLK